MAGRKYSNVFDLFKSKFGSKPQLAGANGLDVNFVNYLDNSVDDVAELNDIQKQYQKAVKEANASKKIGPLDNIVKNNKGVSYPEIIDLKTGKPMTFPDGDLVRVPNEERVVWYKNQSEANKFRMNDTDILCKKDFIDEWYRRGYPDPPLNWKEYDIHHIQPREFGGDSSFENLTPVLRGTHQKTISPWWRSFEE